MNEQNLTGHTARAIGGASRGTLPHANQEKPFSAKVRDCRTRAALPLSITKHPVQRNTPSTITDPSAGLPADEGLAEASPLSFVSKLSQLTASRLDSPLPASEIITPYEQLRQCWRLPMYDIVTSRTALAGTYCADEFASTQTFRPLIEFP